MKYMLRVCLVCLCLVCTQLEREVSEGLRARRKPALLASALTAQSATSFSEVSLSSDSDSLSER
jgi:hypothetical protein